MILLTGASGFLGKEIIKTIDMPNVKTLSRYNADFTVDLKGAVPVFDQKFDVIIHAAGKAHLIPKTEKEKKDFFEINVSGTKNLLHGLEKVGIPKAFVFISTVAVYGMQTGRLINENAPLRAVDAYGDSKIQAEKLVEDWCNKHNVTCAILRLPLLAGANPPGNLGAMIRGIKQGYYFNIAGGKAKKSIVLAEDVAKIIPTAADIGGVYNLTDGYHPSFFELSQVIAKQLDKHQSINMPMWLVNLIAKAGDLVGPKAPINSVKLKKIISDLTFDDTKARRLLGWNPTLVLNGFRIQ